MSTLKKLETVVTADEIVIAFGPLGPLVGVLRVGTREPRAWSAEELAFFQLLTDALGGRLIAQGTLANLRLWKVGGTLRFPHANSNAAAVASACPTGTT